MTKQYEIENQGEWNTIIKKLPGVSVLQTWEWGQAKAKFGWKAKHFAWRGQSGECIAAALVLVREVTIPYIGWGFRTIYIPQGPLLDWSDKTIRKRVLADIIEFSQSVQAIFIKIDPEIILGFEEQIDKKSPAYFQSKKIIQDLQSEKWVYSRQQVQFKNTAWIDLKRPLEEILVNMKQKTRYNIRLAGRKGVRDPVYEDRHLRASR